MSEGALGACCCCISTDPVENDKHADGPATFQTTMLNAPCDNCPAFCCAFVCPWPAQYKLRTDVLGGDMSKYICCQGMFGSCCCLKPGEMGESSCPGEENTHTNTHTQTQNTNTSTHQHTNTQTLTSQTHNTHIPYIIPCMQYPCAQFSPPTTPVPSAALPQLQGGCLST